MPRGVDPLRDPFTDRSRLVRRHQPAGAQRGPRQRDRERGEGLRCQRCRGCGRRHPSPCPRAGDLGTPLYRRLDGANARRLGEG